MDPRSSQDLTDLISTLMSLEAFESIAGPDRQFEAAVPAIRRGVRALVQSFRTGNG
jgi:hypothetical protein